MIKCISIKEAKQKHCPLQQRGYPKDTRCLADKCMKWEFMMKPYPITGQELIDKKWESHGRCTL